MDPITILLIVGGGLLFASRKRKKYAGSASSKDRPIPPPPETPYVPGELVSLEISKEPEDPLYEVHAASEGVVAQGQRGAFLYLKEDGSDFPVDVRFFVKGKGEIADVAVPGGQLLDKGKQDVLIRVKGFVQYPNLDPVALVTMEDKLSEIRLYAIKSYS